MGELTDKIKGNVDEMVGKGKQALAGDADDPNRTHADDKMAAEGAAQELKGNGWDFGWTAGFGAGDTRVLVLDRAGQVVGEAEGDKASVAARILDTVAPA